MRWIFLLLKFLYQILQYLLFLYQHTFCASNSSWWYDIRKVDIWIHVFSDFHYFFYHFCGIKMNLFHSECISVPSCCSQNMLRPPGISNFVLRIAMLQINSFTYKPVKLLLSSTFNHFHHIHLWQNDTWQYNPLAALLYQCPVLALSPIILMRKKQNKKHDNNLWIYESVNRTNNDGICTLTLRARLIVEPVKVFSKLFSKILQCEHANVFFFIWSAQCIVW